MRRGLVTGVAALVLAACGEGGTDPDEPIYALSIRGGDEQQGPAGGVLAEPLQVTVHNAANEVVPGVVVRFRVRSGSGARLLDTISVTGYDGVAGVGAQLGSGLGQYEFEASVRAREIRTVTFRATATPPPTLTAVSPQSFSAGDTVELTGTNFNTILTGNTVLFGTARARVVAGEGGTLLRVVVPPCVPAGPVAVRVQVSALAATNTVTATYVQSTPTLGLEPLQGLTVSGTELGTCLRLAGDGARYLLVPQFAAVDTGPAAQSFRLSATAAGLVADLSPSRAGLPVRPVTPSTGGEGGRSSLQSRFDLALRAQERTLARLAEPPRFSTGREAAPALDIALGDARTFRVLGDIDGESFVSVTARARYIGENIVLYVDEDAPSGGFTADELTRFGDLFDETLYPIAVRAFGSESDIDDNGRVLVLMTPRVNALTTASQCQTEGFVTGYFFGFDLVSRGPNSNTGEVFYSMVPDPGGEFSCVHTTRQVARLVPATFIHELQHMISYNQHVLVRRGSDEDVWLNEGLSHIAEELAAKHYESRSQLDSAALFLRGNAANAYDYLASTLTNSVTTFHSFGSLEERGAAWLFLRWLGDQKGDDIYGRLVQTRHTSRHNIEEQTGETFAGLFGDFGIALWADGLTSVPRSSIPPRYRFHTRSLRQLFALYLGASTSPLTASPLPYGGSVTHTMVQGTSDYFQLLTPIGSQPAALQFAPSAGGVFPPGLQAQLGILRLPDAP